MYLFLSLGLQPFEHEGIAYRIHINVDGVFRCLKGRFEGEAQVVARLVRVKDKRVIRRRKLNLGSFNNYPSIKRAD